MTESEIKGINRREFLILAAGYTGLFMGACKGSDKAVDTKITPVPKVIDITSGLDISSKTGTETFNGFNYSSWWKGELSAPSSDQSLRNLAQLGANWVALCATGYQESVNSTSIDIFTQKTSSDEDLTHAIKTCHDLGLKVMLKPHINLFVEDNNNWRGEIGRGFNDNNWKKWFEGYSGFISHYAEIAAKTGVEAFCIGTELKRTIKQENSWREVIRNLRTILPSPLTYAANFYEEYTQVKFWDDLDYIGVNAYFPLTNKVNSSVETLKQAWIDKRYVATLEELSLKFDRRVIFTEIGYRSVDGANIKPWEYTDSPVLNLNEQANCYSAALQTFDSLGWFNGMLWWAWDPNPDLGGPDDKNYTPYKKPAAEILKAYLK